LLLITNHGKKTKEVTLSKLHETYAKVCKKRSMTPASLPEAVSMTSTLEKCGIFRLWLGKVPKDTTLRLKIDDEKVEAAMQDQALLIGILQDVDCIAE
jgi:cell division control protein 6